MPAIGIDLPKAEMQEVVTALQRLGKNAPAVLKGYALRLLARVQEGYIRNVSDDILRVRTGNLRRWIRVQQVATEAEGIWSWGLPSGETESRIAAKLETGGDILPKNGRLLRVPLPAAMTGAGVDRYAGVSFRDSGLPEGLSVIARPGRTPLIVKILEKKRNSRWELWYALVPKVTLQSHPAFTNAVEAAVETASPEQSLAQTLQQLTEASHVG